ncbi:MAG: GNAT family N-acetyltransferase, partial [Clostridia bacterium]|nr:GNAT family N-acetyltransferase [Clostridia bacterium]
MKHLGTKTIQTERLVLRKFELSDAKYMYQNWAADTDVTKYMSWLPHTGIKDSEDYIKSLILDYDKNNVYNWAIVLKEINQPIG